MFTMSTFHKHTSIKPIVPVDNCTVNGGLVHSLQNLRRLLRDGVPMKSYIGLYPFYL